MKLQFFDARAWLVLLLLSVAAIGVMQAGAGKRVFDISESRHDELHPNYPRSDCGPNFWMIFIKPDGEQCFVTGTDAQKVEDKMEEIDPEIWDQPSIDDFRWNEVLGRALQALGWPF